MRWMLLSCIDQKIPPERVRTSTSAGEQQLLEKPKISTDLIDKHRKKYISKYIFIKVYVCVYMSKVNCFLFPESPACECYYVVPGPLCILG